MKTLIFVLLVLLCFSCTKETEPLNPVQSSEIQGRGGGKQLIAGGAVQLACFGEQQSKTTMYANVVMNVYSNQNGNGCTGDFCFQIMDQNQHQHRKIVASMHQYHVENGVCWLIGQVTHDSKGCNVGDQYQNHGEDCPFRDGDCDKECDCECKCECTCDCECQCRGNCECDCTCECCQCLRHRLRTRLRGAENKAERTRLRTQLRARTCGCDCSCDCECDCPNDNPGDGCDCDCHQHQWRHQFNCHDWCCNGECCDCDCCQNGGECPNVKNQNRNGNGGNGNGSKGAQKSIQNKWQTQHMMQCRVGQKICIRICDGDNTDGCDGIAWRWCDENEPLQMINRLQWQLCHKNIIKGTISIH